jgi:hypothetical protein
MSGRGRGKRAKAVEVSSSTEELPVIKKTTKKKQFPVVAVITPDGIEGNLLAASRHPLVVHLPIQSKDVPSNDMPITYNPLPPIEAQPYDIHYENPFHEELENIDVPLSSSVSSSASSVSSSSASSSVSSSVSSSASSSVSVQPTPLSVSHPVVGTTHVPSEEVDFYRLKGTFLVQYKDSSEVKTIPATSDAACFWCCHTFSHRPVVLPVRDTGEHLIVTGNFCCPECACSYLFDIRQDAHTRWEQLSLLYRVYGEACGGNIHPAPHRTMLTLFGGCLSIDQYRKMIQSHKVRVDIHLPPMVSILSTMDTKPIDFYDSGLTKNVNETVTERLQKAEEVLRLRRTKPLKAWESTLDACINLKIKYDHSKQDSVLSLGS